MQRSSNIRTGKPPKRPIPHKRAIRPALKPQPRLMPKQHRGGR